MVNKAQVMLSISALFVFLYFFGIQTKESTIQIPTEYGGILIVLTWFSALIAGFYLGQLLDEGG